MSLIIFRVGFNKGKTENQSICVTRKQLIQATNKKKFSDILVQSGLSYSTHSSLNFIKFMRISNKSKKCISLESEADFSGMKGFKSFSCIPLVIIDYGNDISESSDCGFDTLRIHDQEKGPVATCSRDILDWVKTNGKRHLKSCCDDCKLKFVSNKKIRYKCLVCEDYVLCENCEVRFNDDKLAAERHIYLHPCVKIVDQDVNFELDSDFTETDKVKKTKSQSDSYDNSTASASERYDTDESSINNSEFSSEYEVMTPTVSYDST